MKKFIPLFVLLTSTCSMFSCQPGVVNLGKFNLHTEAQQAYLDSGDHSKIDADGKAHLDKPKPVTFKIKDSQKHSNYKIYYSYKYKYDDSHIDGEPYVIADSKDASITNLEFNKQYYFKVTADSQTIERGTFTTKPGILNNLDVDGMKNVRDMGGYKTSLGYFKSRMIFRTSELNNSVMDGENDSYVTDKGANVLIDDFKIKTEIDLRMIDEEIPAEYKTESILKAKYGANVNLYQLNIDYDGFNILSEKFRPNMQRFFAILADKNNYPMCFHCHIGTDRTGMFAAAIHSLLGSSLDHIYYDYMLSNFAYIDGTRTEDGINNSYVNHVKDYRGETLADKAYNLLHEKVGVPTRVLDSIRNILLEK